VSRENRPERVRRWQFEVSAGHLLCPAEWFRLDGQRLEWDILDRKAIYSTASYEVVAYRLLDFRPFCIITVLENGRVIDRRSSTPWGIAELHPAEGEVAGEVVRSAA
jgi:hypothetical protein